MFDFIRCLGPWLPQKHAGLLSSHEFLATVDHHRVQIPTTARDRAVKEGAYTKDRARSHGTTVHSSKRRANNDGAGANEPPRKGVHALHGGVPSIARSCPAEPKPGSRPIVHVVLGVVHGL